MPLDKFAQMMLPAVEEEMRACVAQARGQGLEELHGMLAYHLGWEGEGAGSQARGKRVRPLLVLLTTTAAGGVWQHALPCAAAVELVHNFSLIHDDIQDNSPLRRGRMTVWKKWDIPQAINAGDSMFALAHVALRRLGENVPPEISLEAAYLLPQTCLKLTQGQYLDLAYEKRGDLTLESYWPMVGWKTAALMATCTELGALVACGDDSNRIAYRRFGEQLGMAFQVQDDYLGIWGESALTGKSTESDLLTRKKSLPVLYALEKNGEFAERWHSREFTPEDVPELAGLLERDGALEFTHDTVRQLTEEALQALSAARPQGEAGEALAALAMELTNRSG